MDGYVLLLVHFVYIPIYYSCSEVQLLIFLKCIKQVVWFKWSKSSVSDPSVPLGHNIAVFSNCHRMKRTFFLWVYESFVHLFLILESGSVSGWAAGAVTTHRYLNGWRWCPAALSLPLHESIYPFSVIQLGAKPLLTFLGTAASGSQPMTCTNAPAAGMTMNRFHISAWRPTR